MTLLSKVDQLTKIKQAPLLIHKLNQRSKTQNLQIMRVLRTKDLPLLNKQVWTNTSNPATRMIFLRNLGGSSIDPQSSTSKISAATGIPESLLQGLNVSTPEEALEKLPS
jgi:hypothetical protein